MPPSATRSSRLTPERLLAAGCDSREPGALPLWGPAARDREIVRWIGRLGAVSIDQVRERFGLRRTVAYRRIAACVEGGLLDRCQLLQGEPSLLRASARGLRYGGLSLPVARVNPELSRHWLACGWVAVRAGGEAGEEIVSEREIRQLERTERRPLASATVGERPDGSLRLHRPDLALVGAARVVAIEVELTGKAPQRLEAIVRGWCRARCVDLIRYYAPAGAVTAGLRRAIERAHGEDRVEILSLEELL